MVNVETYSGNNGGTVVKEEKNYPDREWLKFPEKQSTKVSNIVLESAYLDRHTKYGEAIYVFGHDGDTGELVAMTFGMSINQRGKRGTVWSRSGVETLLDTEFGEGDRRDVTPIDNPRIKSIFLNKKIWVGKTQVAGKSYNAFECDFMEGEPKFDSSFRGLDEEDEGTTEDETSDKPEFDMDDETNLFILEELMTGVDALQLVKVCEDKFTGIPKAELIRRVMGIKKTME